MVTPYQTCDYIGPKLGLRLGDLFKLQKKGPRKPGLGFLAWPKVVATAAASP